MKYFSLQTQPGVVAILLGVIISLLVIWQITTLLLPQYNKYQRLSETHFLLEKVGQNSLNLVQTIDESRQEVEAISYKLQGDMAGLPDNQIEAYVIGHLQKISWNTEVELASVTPGNGRKVQIYQEALFNVTLNTSYYNFLKWLQAVNSELGFIVVNKFTIQTADLNIHENPPLKISLTLISYQMVDDV